MKIAAILIIMLGLVACKTTQTASNNTSDISKEEFFSVLEKDVKYSHLKIRSKLNADLGKDNIPTINLTIYNEKGKKIWLNGAVSILNVVRGLATPEKLQAYEKINKTYIDEDYQYINELLGINFAKYQTLEKLLLGKPFIDLNPKDFSYTKENNLYQLQSIQPIEIKHNNKTYNYQQQFTFDGNLELIKAVVSDIENQKELSIQYLDREVIKNLNLPKKVKIFIKDKKEKRISLEYTNFEFQKMETPYRVPSNYTKREIK